MFLLVNMLALTVYMSTEISPGSQSEPHPELLYRKREAFENGGPVHTGLRYISILYI